jgi:CRP-like cAMP-binding protein
MRLRWTHGRSACYILSQLFGDRMTPLTAEEARLARLTLDRFPLLREAAAEPIAEASRLARWWIAQPGVPVIDVGDAADEVFLVFSGTLRVMLRTGGGQEVILGELGPGEIFGEMAAIDGHGRSASVMALHTAQLCSLPGPAFLKLVLGAPPAALGLLRLLTARLRRQDERQVELVVLPVRHRLYGELLRMARPREDGQLRVSPPPPHHVLAARVGARREAISREMSALVRSGLAVVTRQSITLPNPAALREAVRVALAGDGAGGAARARKRQTAE